MNLAGIHESYGTEYPRTDSGVYLGVSRIGYRPPRLPWVSPKTLRSGPIIPNPRGIEIIEAILDHAARLVVTASTSAEDMARYRRNAMFLRVLEDSE